MKDIKSTSYSVAITDDGKNIAVASTGGNIFSFHCSECTETI